MRLMCLDVGRKRIGIAVSDALMITAQGIETYFRKSFEEDVKKYKSLIQEYDVIKIIIGLPKNMNNTIGDMAEEIIEYSNRLKDILEVPIELYDERLSTKLATDFLIEGNVSRKKRKNIVDMIAAGLILQSYMERCKNE